MHSEEVNTLLLNCVVVNSGVEDLPCVNPGVGDLPCEYVEAWEPGDLESAQLWG